MYADDTTKDDRVAPMVFEIFWMAPRYLYA